MPAFAYQALDSSGKTQRGVLQGDTARAVRGLLRERGLDPLQVDEVGEARAARPFARRGLGAAQLALLTRQLATLVGAGLPLLAGGVGGAGMFVTPRAGFLIGFPLAAFAVSRAAPQVAPPSVEVLIFTRLPLPLSSHST